VASVAKDDVDLQDERETAPGHSAKVDQRTCVKRHVNLHQALAVLADTLDNIQE